MIKSTWATDQATNTKQRKLLDLVKSCRVCMRDDVSMVDLFQSLKGEECALSLAEALAECTVVQAVKDDGLPPNLCDECLTQLQNSYTFRKQAEKADNEFRKLISLHSTVKQESISDDFKSENNGENDIDDYNDFLDLSYTIDQNDVKPYECDKYVEKFEGEDTFLNHNLTCTVCQKTFNTQTSLEKHFAKHKYEQHNCKMCDQIFDDGSHLLDHIMVAHSEIQLKIENEIDNNIFKCTQCDTVFDKQRSLAMHMKKHKNRQTEKMESFVCDVCKKSFSQKGLLKRHIKIHNNDRPLACSECPKRYYRQDQLKAHMKKHSEKKPNVCSFCNKGFIQLCTLRDHMRTHTGEVPFLCSQCGKGFNNRSNLRQHMIRHTGVKPFACSLCPKTFCTKGQMTCHLTTHTGAHPYTCERCGAAFTKPNSLKKHQLIHLGVKPFACDACSMRFSCKDHLKRHYRIHTGEKPYRCRFCERAFTQSNDLVKHMRVHIGDNIYQCTVCDEKFRLKSELKLHYPVHYVNGSAPADLGQPAGGPQPGGPAQAPEPPAPGPRGQLAPGPREQVAPGPRGQVAPPAPDAADAGRTFTITLLSNMFDKNRIAGDITINISPSKT